MGRTTGRRLAAAALLMASLWTPLEAAQQTNTEKPAPDPAGRLLAALGDPFLELVVVEVLENNPQLAAARARARAAEFKAPQARALPDPTLGLTAFVAPPETRVGPQRLMVGISQRLPGLGKLELRERAALLEAAALRADVTARRLQLVTEARRLWYELAFLERYGRITREFRQHLEQHEEIARTRYATGVGLGQGVVKLQAEITRVESQLLEIRQRSSVLVARLNGLRDRPAASLPVPQLPGLGPVHLDRHDLERRATQGRPELAAAAARIEQSRTLRTLAERRSRPDFSVGLTYTAVDSRQDAAGRLQPPPDNGDDVLGFQGGLTLPVWRRSLRAALAEATERQRGAEEARRSLEAAISADLGELTDRIQLGWRQLRLLEDVLILQAEESLDSARAGYVTGTLNALDLLDAEHVLFDARTAVARAASDYAISLARLEGAVAEPLESGREAEEPTS